MQTPLWRKYRRLAAVLLPRMQSHHARAKLGGELTITSGNLRNYQANHFA